MKGLGHISLKKKGWLFPKDQGIKFGILVISDVLNYPKTGNLVENHFWPVATPKKRGVLIT